MQRLLHRRQRLSRLLRSLRHPRITSVRVGDEIVPLPLRIRFEEPLEQNLYSMSNQQLRQISYAFSVFGRITPYPCSSGFSLIVITRLQRVSIPLGFCRAFGGRVAIEKPGKGVALPNVSWKVHGPEAVRVSSALSGLGFESRKQEILKIGAAWPREKSKRLIAAQRLRDARQSLRNSFFENGSVGSWEDLVELFDYRGHIVCCTGSNSVRIRIYHQNEGLLRSISAFLMENYVVQGKQGKDVYCYGSGRKYWCCQKEASIKLICRKLLEYGLTYQQARVSSALKLLEENPGVRKGELSVFGDSVQKHYLPEETNSMKYKRDSKQEYFISQLLTGVSVEMAQKKRRGLGRKFEDQDEWIRSLKRQKKLLKQSRVLCEMKGDIRSLLKNLREGGP